MTSKKLPSQLTDEEILAMLDMSEEIEPDHAQIFEYSDDIVPFLSFYKITPGNTPVSKNLIYKLYKTFSKSPVNERTFNLAAGKFLTPNGQQYLINTDQFAISKQIYTAQKKRDKTKSIASQKHFDWFLTEAKMSKGTHWIEGFILFFQYKDFCRQRRVNPKLGYKTFHNFLKLHFQSRRIKENRALWFKIDEQTFNTYTEEERNVIRRSRSEKTRRSEKEKDRTEEAPQS